MSIHYIFPSLQGSCLRMCAILQLDECTKDKIHCVSLMVSRAWKLSQESKADAVFVCSKPAMLRNVIKGIPVLHRCIHVSEDSSWHVFSCVGDVASIRGIVCE